MYIRNPLAWRHIYGHFANISMRVKRQTENVPSAIDLRKLQERISELTAEKERLSKDKQQCYDELNDVIIYLKKTIEEQDYEIARLEDIRKQQLFEQEKRITKERETIAMDITKLNNDIEKYRAENLLMKTQIGNEHRVEMELMEANSKLTAMEKELKEKNLKIIAQEAHERQLIIELTEKIRNELNAENELERMNTRKTLHIQNVAEMKMSQEVIAQLEETIENGQMQIAKLNDRLNEKNELLENYEANIKFQETEIQRLRKHIERSTNQTEKALKDSKRRIEEIERNRATIISQHAEILKQLKKENSELIKQLKRLTQKYEKLQDSFLKEKHLRELTIEAHTNQNNKLEQLRCFLQTTMAQREDDIYIDAIIVENRIALFAKIALLIQQIPIVK